MKKNEITCDLCGVTVATKKDVLFSRFETEIPYITIDYNYLGVKFGSDGAYAANAKKDYHICENCLGCIKKDLVKRKVN